MTPPPLQPLADRIQPDDVQAALEVISGRVPDRHVTPDDVMAASWYPDLQRFRRDALFLAARGWSGLRFPSVGELVDACQSASQLLASQRAQENADAERAAGPCATPGCDGGLIIVSDGGTTDTVHPCSNCRPVQHAVWMHRTAEGHDEEHCADCIAMRRKKDLPGWLLDAREAAANRGRSKARKADNF